MRKKLQFLKVRGADIVDERGRRVMLKGAALGGWLMMEGYMMCGRNIPEKTLKANITKSLGSASEEDFTDSFRRTFITESDIKAIKSWGANLVRIPFNYKIIDKSGIRHLDNVIGWCRKNSIYCILDMHAAPGAQNGDWHSDCVGRPELFTGKANQDKYLKLWRFLARRYKNESAIAGYDILNEPVVPFTRERIVKELFEKVTAVIRAEGDDHIIFQEGNFWGQRIKCLGKPKDPNTAFSVHIYAPSDYVFNWDLDHKYPCKIAGVMWNKKRLEAIVKEYSRISKKVGAPIFVGEFGVSWRGGHFGELDWTKDIVSLFKKYGFHWTYWTYKTIANSHSPDGIYRYTKNPAWINRKGPVTGWENFYTLWKKERGGIIESWRTRNFVLNEKLLGVLKKYI